MKLQVWSQMNLWIPWNISHQNLNHKYNHNWDKSKWIFLSKLLVSQNESIFSRFGVLQNKTFSYFIEKSPPWKLFTGVSTMGVLPFTTSPEISTPNKFDDDDRSNTGVIVYRIKHASFVSRQWFADATSRLESLSLQSGGFWFEWIK